MSAGRNRVQPGQRIENAFSARAWNRAQDAADIVLGESPGIELGNSGSVNRRNLIVTVQNDSFGLVPRFGVLSIKGVAVNPTASDSAEAAFAQQPVLVGASPSVSSYGDRFVVCLEPIAHGAYGRAIISGMFACKVRINQLSHTYATAKLDDRTQLQSTTCGPVLLLWKDVAGWSLDDRDDRWAVGVM